MASFKNKTTGVILSTENKEVIEQLKKNPDYVSCKAPKTAKTAAEPPADSTDDSDAE